MQPWIDLETAMPPSISVPRPAPPLAEIADLLDRFLRLFEDANREYGGLFPYKYLRREILARLEGRTARVVVRGPSGEPCVAADVAWCDGGFRRVAGDRAPALVWSLPLEVLEHAAAEPWSYLAHPRRLQFAWFQAGEPERSTESWAERSHPAPCHGGSPHPQKKISRPRLTGREAMTIGSLRTQSSDRP